jgi:hypothetical protein
MLVQCARYVYANTPGLSIVKDTIKLEKGESQKQLLRVCTQNLKIKEYWMKGKYMSNKDSNFRYQIQSLEPVNSLDVAKFFLLKSP